MFVLWFIFSFLKYIIAQLLHALVRSVVSAVAFLNLSDVVLSLLLYIIVIISNAAYSLELNLI